MKTIDEEVWQAYQKVIMCAACTDCGDRKILRDDIFNLPQPGYVGSNYESKRVLLLGQNPGISPERFREKDEAYAEALATVADMPGRDTMQQLQSLLDEFIPTWPVTENYFPLNECGLNLGDIAYFNVVRCRTIDNAAPSEQMVANCVDRHFEAWLDLLQPRVVVCIGKWAHDQVGGILESRGIPHRAMNRMRSLSSEERRRNRDDVVLCVRQALDQLPHAVAQEKPAVAVSADTGNSQVGGPSTWNAEAFAELFRRLGFADVELRKTLKHPRGLNLPSLYFNKKRDESVYFTGYRRDKLHFDNDLWVFLPPQQKKDAVPSLITVLPKAGKEKDAFEGLLGQ